jgi:predicted secreted protein
MRCSASVCLLLALAACTNPGAARVTQVAEPPAAGAASITRVIRGSHLEVELPFSAGTGYAWTAGAFNPAILALESQKSIEPARSDGDAPRVGGPMSERFRFKARELGTVEIVFELRRSWEKDVPAVDTRRMRVEVIEGFVR